MIRPKTTLRRMEALPLDFLPAQTEIAIAGVQRPAPEGASSIHGPILAYCTPEPGKKPRKSP